MSRLQGFKEVMQHLPEHSYILIFHWTAFGSCQTGVFVIKKMEEIVLISWLYLLIDAQYVKCWHSFRQNIYILFFVNKGINWCIKMLSRNCENSCIYTLKPTIPWYGYNQCFCPLPENLSDQIKNTPLFLNFYVQYMYLLWKKMDYPLYWWIKWKKWSL